MSVEMYYMPSCPYCKRALDLLKSKGADVTIYDVNQDAKLWEESKSRSGRDTVPQIFINDQHIGGCDDLVALNAKGGLDPLLAK
ncbi:glutaredoxin 3 [Wohlfahrtiimonas chitiniclastica]|uniref:Glutaredoxin n=2 Tax=Wohlfahrtiimonas chitiniclastica TaxID=400946 RepID=L8XUN3_9GAMM|nr:glutaredoxin 3 [Wohlfahrtiimonas chitiniclastica]ELV07758.1 Glutaredoxin-3 [Wohlfahrtiimonas chitiniclastica SH04]KZX37010.1 glutaredoxin [Wohlfahrtiimonas chitiniclastica]MBS7815439.1 glutaredoxin 3 [Wohlfahrtiimonas chitiniclastica]MBS7817615.1 glutaredoxin 3 [Wohlfahrtiimonas chitiniclastica]MBS7819503.1 glutaredoxin 3 [Wohlfahrtiimonas chitiniclastica]